MRSCIFSCRFVNARDVLVEKRGAIVQLLTDAAFARNSVLVMRADGESWLFGSAQINDGTPAFRATMTMKYDPSKPDELCRVVYNVAREILDALSKLAPTTSSMVQFIPPKL